MALSLGGAGCEHRATDQMTQAVESGERPVAMAGGEAFFGGRLTVRVTVSRGIGHGFKRTHNTLLTGANDFAATHQLSDEDKANELEAKEAYDDYERSRPNIGSPLPPVTLHVILINEAADPLTVQIVDFNSDLGNFAIDPDTFTVAPGLTAEPTPMVSQLGVGGDVIPVTVTLKFGSTKETRIVLVKNLLDSSGKPKE
jgi:hypothetical protein